MTGNIIIAHNESAIKRRKDSKIIDTHFGIAERCATLKIESEYETLTRKERYSD
jgi:hypothetical protein